MENSSEKLKKWMDVIEDHLIKKDYRDKNKKLLLFCTEDPFELLENCEVSGIDRIACSITNKFPTNQEKYDYHTIIFTESGYILKDKLGLKDVSDLQSLIGSSPSEKEILLAPKDFQERHSN